MSVKEREDPYNYCASVIHGSVIAKDIHEYEIGQTHLATFFYEA